MITSTQVTDGTTPVARSSDAVAPNATTVHSATSYTSPDSGETHRSQPLGARDKCRRNTRRDLERARQPAQHSSAPAHAQGRYDHELVEHENDQRERSQRQRDEDEPRARTSSEYRLDVPARDR